MEFATNLTNATNVTPSRMCGDIILTSIIVIVIMLCAGLGNSLVIGSSLLDPQIRRGGFLPMLSLAISDLTFIEVTCTGMLYALFSNGNGPLIDQTCLGIGIFELFCVIVMMFQHCLLAVIQFIAICHPMRYRLWITTRKILLALLALYLIAFIIALLPSTLPTPWNPWLIQVYDASLLICLYKAHPVIQFYASVFYFAIPFVISTYCYAMCMKTLKSQTRAVNHNEINKNHSVNFHQQSRLALTMFITFSIIIFNSTPFPVTWMLYMNNDKCSVVKRHLCWFFLANGCCNPIVYAVKSSKFRRMFARQLGIKLANNQVIPLSTMTGNNNERSIELKT